MELNNQPLDTLRTQPRTPLLNPCKRRAGTTFKSSNRTDTPLCTPPTQTLTPQQRSPILTLQRQTLAFLTRLFRLFE